jgi:hypothetical protein
VKPSSGSIEFTPAERAALEEKQRRLQDAIEWIARADTPEEQERRGGRAWSEQVERPRAARRFEAARRPRTVAVVVPTRTAGAVATPRERRDSSSSRSSGQDPGDDSDPDDGCWALSFVDRAPFLWRFRALRCRILEAREAIRMGVDR